MNPITLESALRPAAARHPFVTRRALRAPALPFALALMSLVAPLLALAGTAARAGSAPEGDGDPKLTRVFVEANESWESAGGILGNPDGLGGGTRGGARPQRAEVMKAFRKLPECAAFGVTLVRDKANFTLLLDYDGGKLFFEKDSKVALFDPNGDLIHTESRTTVKAAVRGACLAIQAASGRVRTPGH